MKHRNFLKARFSVVIHCIENNEISVGFSDPQKQVPYRKWYK